jgi:hypothetical protein
MRSTQQFARYAFLGLLALLALSQVALAGPVALNDWCVNVNGDATTACNGTGGGGASGLASISLAGFDTTLSPAGNSLGSVVITLNPGFSGYASFYADYDLDFASYGSFQDSASTGGTLQPGESYEADDPNVSNIFSDFANNALANTNNVGTASGPSSPSGACCDVSFALSIGGLDNTGTQPETLTFTVSTSAPTSGFYIQQTNTDVGDSIYLSATESGGTSGPVIPEPSTLVLALLGGLSALMWRRLFAA